MTISDPMTDAEKRALRNAFGGFATGVTVVTTREADGTPRGFTANSFTSVSLDPPLLLVCIAKTAHSCDTFCTSDHFAVNVLSETQKDMSGLFASQSPDKFEQAEWVAGANDMPLLPDSLCTFVCARHEAVDAGDHVVLIGRVVDHATVDAPPLGYHKGSYFSIGLEERLVNAAARIAELSVGAIMEQDKQILLSVAVDGNVSVPIAPANARSLQGFVETLQNRGLSPSLDHLYAVYEDHESMRQCVVYHGTTNGEAPEGMAYFPLGKLPLAKITNEAERVMLRRYQHEYRHGSFGIYHGDAESGVVNRVDTHQNRTAKECPQ